MKIHSICFFGILLLSSTIVSCFGEAKIKKINNYSESRLQAMKEHNQYTVDEKSDELSLSIHNLVAPDIIEYSESKYNCNEYLHNNLEQNYGNGLNETKTRSNMRRY